MDFIITVTDTDLRNETVGWLINELPKIQKGMKEVAGLFYDNDRVSYSLYGELFSLMFSQRSCVKGSVLYNQYNMMSGARIVVRGASDSLLFNVYTFSMWDSKGMMSLNNGTFVCNPDKPLPIEVQKAIYGTARDYIDGTVHCSHCNEVLERDEIAGSYFAGVYCQECWDREYRVREANESYN